MEFGHNPELGFPVDDESTSSEEIEKENSLGEEFKTVEEIAAEVFYDIDQLTEEDKERVLAVFEGVSEDSIAMFAGWKENMNGNEFVIKLLREQFDVLAEKFAEDRNVRDKTQEDLDMEGYMTALTLQSARGIRTSAKILGVDEQLLDEVIPPEVLGIEQ